MRLSNEVDLYLLVLNVCYFFGRHFIVWLFCCVILVLLQVRLLLQHHIRESILVSLVFRVPIHRRSLQAQCQQWDKNLSSLVNTVVSVFMLHVSWGELRGIVHWLFTPIYFTKPFLCLFFFIVKMKCGLPIREWKPFMWCVKKAFLMFCSVAVASNWLMIVFVRCRVDDCNYISMPLNLVF